MPRSPQTWTRLVAEYSSIPVRLAAALEENQVRTCVICRQKAGRDRLLRLVAQSGGTVVADYRRVLPGRGAWIHPAKRCLSAAKKSPGRLARALRVDRVSGLDDALAGIDE